MLTGKQNFCSPECFDGFQSRCDPNYNRWLVMSRDRGVCASCGLDTRALEKEIRSSNDADIVCQEIVRRGFDPDRSFWEMDHIRPVRQGGGLCEIDNLQTLCVPCHKQKTASPYRSPALALS